MVNVMPTLLQPLLREPTPKQKTNCQEITTPQILVYYVIVIPCPQELYGIYCLSPRPEPKGKGNKSHAARVEVRIPKVHGTLIHPCSRL